MCNIAGAILWQINSRKGVLVNPSCCFNLADPVDAFRFVATVEDLYVLHHLFGGVIPFVALCGLVHDLCKSFH